MVGKKLFIATVGFGLTVPAMAANFFYNQVGYDRLMPKTAIVQSTASLAGASFSLVSGGSAVYSGTLDAGSNPDNWSSSGSYFVADFSDFTTPGTYSLQVIENGNSETSGTFRIELAPLTVNVLPNVLEYFYKDRANNSTIESWDQKVSVYGSSGVTRDVRGGWYDASGDVSKYFSHLSYANYLNPQQIPLTVWSLAMASVKIPSLLGGTPTSATAVQEALYGADFLVRMLDDQGFFYMTVFDNWGSGSRYLCAFSGSDGIKSADYKTAYREGGGMAIAALALASTLGSSGSFSSAEYLAAAKKGFEHLQARQSIGGACEYCDNGEENIIDDYTALLAATELYLATGDTSYRNVARDRAEHLEGRLSDVGYFWSDDAKTRPFWHASDAGLPVVALTRYMEMENLEKNDGSDVWVELACNVCPIFNSALSYAASAVKDHLQWLLDVTNETDNPFGYARQTVKTGGSIKNSFFIPHDNESNYWWQGENARLASLAAASLYANRVLGEDSVEGVGKYAVDQLDWILGKNPYGVCMMQGMGVKNPAVYDGQSNYDATLVGGIANGISGLNTDGSGIVWDDVAAIGKSSEPWNNWRWIEQWLPHSTWFLNALVALYDEVTTESSIESLPQTKAAPAVFGVSVTGGSLLFNFGRSLIGSTVRVISLDGRIILGEKVSAERMSLEIPAHAKGIFMVQVPGASARKIVIH